MSDGVAVVTAGAAPEVAGLSLDDRQAARLHECMSDTLHASSMLFVPIGAGPECLGSVALTRRGPSTDWSGVERQAALEPDLTTSVTDSTAAMERAVERMRCIIDDLLLAEVGDPDTVPDVQSVDLTDVISEALDLLGVTIDQKHLEIQLHVPPTPVRVRGGQHELFQLCVNLLSNAVKYTPEGGTITVSLDRAEGDVRLGVADTGIGISKSDQHRLFDEFFRSTDPAALAVPGTGLGLSIVHRIVERHDGGIAVDSTSGPGPRSPSPFRRQSIHPRATSENDANRSSWHAEGAGRVAQSRAEHRL
ncbi:hypothetical protein ASC64_09375 [Nocardioides sp. Root122]|nr:hypothetical protein ASC64_09375 [Nocardioides sp. Root122]